ncbi:MAG: F-actin-capping protein subunit beta [archaeon]|nr:F-actin-capping protein subunit beta [archaeon]
MSEEEEAQLPEAVQDQITGEAPAEGGEPIEGEAPAEGGEPVEEVPPPKEYKPPCPTIEKCIQLNQLLPVSELDKNIDAISNAIYDYDDLLNEFLQKVDNRTTVSKEDPKGDFIKCEQNREGDSYRSPFSNKFFPPTSDGRPPSGDLRKLEERLNEMFKVYVKNYYSPMTLCSCYCWDLGSSIKDGYGVAVVIKTSINHSSSLNNGKWDSSNVMTVKFTEEGGKIKGQFSLVTSVNIGVGFRSKVSGDLSLSGAIARSSQKTKQIKKYDDLVAQTEIIGEMIEDMESNLRATINEVYIQKSKAIIDTARANPTYGKPGIAQAQALKMAFMQGHKP